MGTVLGSLVVFTVELSYESLLPMMTIWDLPGQEVRIPGYEANKKESPWPKVLQKTKSSKHRLFGKRKNIFEICLSVDLKLRVSKTPLISGLNNPQVPHL